jgi:hypothetical protein
MAQPDFTSYRQLNTGHFVKISDSSGPYVWDGTTMELVDKEDVESADTPPSYDTVSITSVQTAATGANYTAFGAAACVGLDLVNNSGTAIEYRRGAAGTSFVIPDGASRFIEGITNASQIDVRRVDQSNTQVTLSAERFVS